MSHDPAAAATLAPLFGALGDPTRLAIVARLGGGADMSITALARGTDLTRQAVTKHLRVLEDAAIIGRRKAGREVRYSLRPSRLTEAQRFLDAVGAEWDAALVRLADHVQGS